MAAPRLLLPTTGCASNIRGVPAGGETKSVERMRRLTLGAGTGSSVDVTMHRPSPATTSSAGTGPVRPAAPGPAPTRPPRPSRRARPRWSVPPTGTDDVRAHAGSASPPRSRRPGRRTRRARWRRRAARPAGAPRQARSAPCAAARPRPRCLAVSPPRSTLSLVACTSTPAPCRYGVQHPGTDEQPVARRQVDELEQQRREHARVARGRAASRRTQPTALGQRRVGAGRRRGASGQDVRRPARTGAGRSGSASR